MPEYNEHFKCLVWKKIIDPELQGVMRNQELIEKAFEEKYRRQGKSMGCRRTSPQRKRKDKPAELDEIEIPKEYIAKIDVAVAHQIAQ